MQTKTIQARIIIVQVRFHHSLSWSTPTQNMARIAKIIAPALNTFATNPDAAPVLGVEVDVDDDDADDADVELAATEE